MFTIELTKNEIILRKVDNDEYFIGKIKELSDKQKIRIPLINRNLESGLIEIKLSLINYRQEQLGFMIYSILEIESKNVKRF